MTAGPLARRPRVKIQSILAGGRGASSGGGRRVGASRSLQARQSKPRPARRANSGS